MRTLIPAPPRGGPIARVRRAATLGLLALAALAAVAALSLGGMRLARAGALPGTQVADLEVGGLAEGELAAAVRRYAERREQAPVTVASSDTRVSGVAADLGYRLDVDATVQAVLRRGRQANPLAALADQLRAFGGTIEVEPVEDVDDARLDAWLENTAGALNQFPVEGTLEFDGATITRVDPQPGAVVPPGPLRERLLAVVLDADGDNVVQAGAEPVEPETTVEDVDAVLAQAERAVSAPVTLSRGDRGVTFSPDDIGNLLAVARDGGDLRLEVDPASLADVVAASTLEAFATEPVDARFTVSGGAVSISPSREGFRFDPQTAAAQLLAVATSEGPRDATLEGEVIPPQLSTADAEALRIVERVSTFTTEFPAAQSRVTNIHRIADLVDGVLLEPGETFSVNRHVGPRTTAKGFVGGGAIFEGEFVEQIGGGVSQFATTLYNAAYFGGYAIPQHKAHSYYISRYPPGREATLNYPDVDLVIRNNSPHGALIKTAHTGTSVTVSIYGTRWVNVESVPGERTNVTAPPLEVRPAPNLAPGGERVVQEGRPGFDITVTRVLTFPDGRVEQERVFTRYLPEPRIVERGP
ncbi:MAG TPA: VanW family protein [Egibacteraceae bacterium]|jgi:vancomycin resistance protein YoaR|nr:VanW family protein [Egibacteraceae bacterium]